MRTDWWLLVSRCSIDSGQDVMLTMSRCELFLFQEQETIEHPKESRTCVKKREIQFVPTNRLGAIVDLERAQWMEYGYLGSSEPSIKVGGVKQRMMITSKSRVCFQ